MGHTAVDYAREGEVMKLLKASETKVGEPRFRLVREGVQRATEDLGSWEVLGTAVLKTSFRGS